MAHIFYISSSSCVESCNMLQSSNWLSQRLLLQELVAHIYVKCPHVCVNGADEWVASCTPNCWLSFCLSAFLLACVNVIKNLSNGVGQYDVRPLSLSCLCLLFFVCLFVGSLSLHSLALSECFLVAQETVTSLRWNIPLFLFRGIGCVYCKGFPPIMHRASWIEEQARL